MQWESCCIHKSSGGVFWGGGGGGGGGGSEFSGTTQVHQFDRTQCTVASSQATCSIGLHICYANFVRRCIFCTVQMLCEATEA